MELGDYLYQLAVDDEIFTVHDVAKYLRISEAKVYRLAQGGKIPATRIGRAWRFSKYLLEKWAYEQSMTNLR